MGSAERRKGHDFERRIANELKPMFPDARRHLEYQDGEANGVDIEGVSYYRIQCKKRKNYSPVMTIAEVDCDRDLGDVPVVITAGDGLEPMAILPWDDLKRLIFFRRQHERVH